MRSRRRVQHRSHGTRSCTHTQGGGRQGSMGIVQGGTECKADGGGDEAGNSTVIEGVDPVMANEGELIRHGDGFWCGSSIHGAGVESDVSAFPVLEGCDISAVEAQLRATGRERRGRDLRVDEGRDPKVEDGRAEPEVAKGIPPDGDDGATAEEAEECQIERDTETEKEILGCIYNDGVFACTINIYHLDLHGAWCTKLGKEHSICRPTTLMSLFLINFN